MVMTEFVRVVIQDEDERETIELAVTSESPSWLVGQEVTSRGLPDADYRRVEAFGRERVIDKRRIVERVELRFDQQQRTLRAAAPSAAHPVESSLTPSPWPEYLRSA
jgi:hypothetical protein